MLTVDTYTSALPAAQHKAAEATVCLVLMAAPVARTHVPRHELPRADFRVPQDEDHDTVVEVQVGSSKVSDWVPAIVDYLYVSLSKSSAFSPTDTMPLSTRAKILMGIESTSALVISVLVIAKASAASASRGLSDQPRVWRPGAGAPIICVPS